MSRRRLGQKVRNSPFYPPMKELLGGTDWAATLAVILIKNGIQTPEELRDAAYMDLRSIQGIGAPSMSYLSGVRNQLRAIKEGRTD